MDLKITLCKIIHKEQSDWKREKAGRVRGVVNDRDGKKTSGELSQTGKRQPSAEAMDMGLPHTGNLFTCPWGVWGSTCGDVGNLSESPGSWAESDGPSWPEVQKQEVLRGGCPHPTLNAPLGFCLFGVELHSSLEEPLGLVKKTLSTVSLPLSGLSVPAFLRNTTFD